jgi:hypothetical protein
MHITTGCTGALYYADVKSGHPRGRNLELVPMMQINNERMVGVVGLDSQNTEEAKRHG